MAKIIQAKKSPRGCSVASDIAQARRAAKRMLAHTPIEAALVYVHARLVCQHRALRRNAGKPSVAELFHINVVRESANKLIREGLHGQW